MVHSLFNVAMNEDLRTRVDKGEVIKEVLNYRAKFDNNHSVFQEKLGFVYLDASNYGMKRLEQKEIAFNPTMVDIKDLEEVIEGQM